MMKDYRLSTNLLVSQKKILTYSYSKYNSGTGRFQTLMFSSDSSFVFICTFPRNNSILDIKIIGHFTYNIVPLQFRVNSPR
jgi:hypothetical protein